MDILMNRIIQTVLLAIILSGLGFYFLSIIPNGKKIHNELTELQSDYDSLLLAKQETIVRYDTIRDTLVQREYIPDTTFDTIYMEKEYKANWYHETMADTNISIDYSILTFGELKHFGLSYELTNKTTEVNNIVYIDRPVEVEVWYPKRTLTLYNSFSSDLSVLQLGLMYTTKKNISFNTSYLRTSDGQYINIGIGYTFRFK